MEMELSNSDVSRGMKKDGINSVFFCVTLNKASSLVGKELPTLALPSCGHVLVGEWCSQAEGLGCWHPSPCSIVPFVFVP